MDRPDVKLATNELRNLTGVKTHDFALVLDSGWAKAADIIGESCRDPS